MDRPCEHGRAGVVFSSSPGSWDAVAVGGESDPSQMDFAGRKRKEGGDGFGLFLEDGGGFLSREGDSRFGSCAAAQLSRLETASASGRFGSSGCRVGPAILCHFFILFFSL